MNYRLAEHLTDMRWSITIFGDVQLLYQLIFHKIDIQSNYLLKLECKFNLTNMQLLFSETKINAEKSDIIEQSITILLNCSCNAN